VPTRDTNVLEYLFRAKDADKVERASKDVRDALRALDPAANKADDALDRVEDGVDDLAKAQRDLANAPSLKDRLNVQGVTKIAGAFALGSVAVSGFNKVLDTLGDSWDFTINKAAEQEQAVLKLEAAMKTAGTFTRQGSRDFQQFAADLQEVTAAGDESTIALGAFIAQLGGIKGDKLKEATRLALDLQAATGKTSQEVGLLFGKLAQGETGTLTEIGIVIDQTIPRAEKFAAALEAIEATFGGTAQATVRSYTGATQQLANAWGDFGEAIGEGNLPGLTRLAQTGTKIFASLAESIRSMANETEHSVPEMARTMDLQMAAMAGSTGKMRLELERGIAQIRRASQEELSLTIRTGDLDSVIATLSELDDVIETATRTGGTAFAAMIRDMREQVREEFAVRIRLEATQAGAELANLSNSFAPEVTLDVLVGGTDQFRDAVRLARGARDEIEKPFVLGGEFQVIDLEAMRGEVVEAERILLELQRRFVPQDAAAKFALDLDINAAEESLADIRADYDQTLERLRKNIEGGEVTFTLGGPGGKSFAETARDFADQLPAAVADAQKDVVVQATLKIDAATSVEELAAALSDIEKKAIEAIGKSHAAPENKQLEAVRDALIDAALAAQALAKVKQATLELQDEMATAVAPVARVTALLGALQRAAWATSFEQIKTAELIQGTRDAAAANSVLEESIATLLERGEPKELVAAFAQLGATISAADDGILALDDDMVEAMRRSRAEVKELLEELQPLSQARLIAIQAKIDLSAGDRAAFEVKLEEIRLLVEEFPDLKIGVVLERLEGDLLKFDKAAKKGAKDTTQTIEDQIGQTTFSAFAQAGNAVFDGLINDAQDAGDAIENIMGSMVNAIIAELGKLAALSIFKLFIGLASGGGSSAISFLPGFDSRIGKPGLGDDPGKPGGPSSRTPEGSDFPVRQFIGETVRSFDDAVQALSLQNALLIESQPKLFRASAADAVSPFLEPPQSVTTVNAEIRALDSADFERYLRAGPGGRAIAALASTGRL